jgi:hypothetical protein
LKFISLVFLFSRYLPIGLIAGLLAAAPAGFVVLYGAIAGTLYMLKELGVA